VHHIAILFFIFIRLERETRKQRRCTSMGRQLGWWWCRRWLLTTI